MSAVLVTGGFGAMGRYVVPELLDRGTEVVVADVSTESTSGRDVTARQVDVTDLDSVVAVLDDVRPDAVLHLAAKVARNDEEPAQSIRLNCLGTYNVLEAAKRAGVRRVVAASTRGTYGSFDGPHGAPDYAPTPETYRTAPAGLYGASKLAGEYIVKSFRRFEGMDAASTRQAWTFGPGKVGVHGVYGIYSSIVEGVLRGERVEVPRGADQLNDIIYNGDVARGLVQLVLHPEPLAHDTYNIAGGVGITLGEFASRVHELLAASGTPEPVIGAGRGFEGFHDTGFGVLDISRIRSETRWEPRPLEEVLRDYADRAAAPV